MLFTRYLLLSTRGERRAFDRQVVFDSVEKHVVLRGGVSRPSALCVLTAAVLTLGALGVQASELHMKKVAYLNRGLDWTFGRVVPFRVSSDSYPLVIFAGQIPYTWGGVYFYRYAPWNRYQLAKVDTGNMGSGLVPGNMVPWASDDVDGDGLSELLAQNSEFYEGGFYLLACLYAEPAPGRFPDSLVWRHRYDSLVAYGSAPFYIADLDQDTSRDIFVFDDRGGKRPCVRVLRTGFLSRSLGQRDARRVSDSRLGTSTSTETESSPLPMSVTGG